MPFFAHQPLLSFEVMSSCIVVEQVNIEISVVIFLTTM